MKAVELFGGAGGLAFGVSKAGFKHELLVEWDKDAASTLRKNSDILGIDNWKTVQQIDVGSVDYRSLNGEIALLAGGPPCQPFSVGGKHLGDRDRRDMFSEAVRAARELRPKAILLENVGGLARPRFAAYLAYLLEWISVPEVEASPGEEWQAHRRRIQWEIEFSHDALRYRVESYLVDAADFGVPQRRRRLFIVAWREDVSSSWIVPKPTHSADRLCWDQWVSGAYWARHGLKEYERPAASIESVRKANGLNYSEIRAFRPWRTVRDTIGDLPPPYERYPHPYDSQHYLIAGARSYKGHTGSPPDSPAKALKAGDHGVPGGENTLRIGGGSVRYFSIREAARLQTFPDTYQITGSWTEGMRQLGNAVPVSLSEVFAKGVYENILQKEDHRQIGERTLKEDHRQIGERTLTAAAEKAIGNTEELQLPL